MNAWLLFFVALGPIIGAVLYLSDRPDAKVVAWNQLIGRLAERYKVNCLPGNQFNQLHRMVGTAPGGHRLELRADVRFEGDKRVVVSQLKIQPKLRRSSLGAAAPEEALVHSWDGLWLREEDLVALIDSGLEHANRLAPRRDEDLLPSDDTSLRVFRGRYHGAWRSYLDEQEKIEVAIDQAMLHLHAKMSVSRLIKEAPKERVMTASEGSRARVMRYWGRPYAVRCETSWQSDQLGVYGSTRSWDFRGLPKGLKIGATVTSSAREQALEIVVIIQDPEQARHAAAASLLSSRLEPHNIAWDFDPM